MRPGIAIRIFRWDNAPETLRALFSDASAWEWLAQVPSTKLEDPAAVALFYWAETETVDGESGSRLIAGKKEANE